jgi:hypothetical protein
LSRLKIDERLMDNGTHWAGDQMVNSLHGLLVSRPQGRVARLNRLSIQAHRASTTVTTPATEANTFAIELLAQNIEQRRLLSHCDSLPFTVQKYFCQDMKSDGSKSHTALGSKSFESIGIQLKTFSSLVWS